MTYTLDTNSTFKEPFTTYFTPEKEGTYIVNLNINDYEGVKITDLKFVTWRKSKSKQSRWVRVLVKAKF